MSGLDVLLAVLGCAVTALTIAGMVLLTPRGGVDLYADEPDSQGVDLSRADARRAAPVAPASEGTNRTVAELR
jgi:hypothetical protein